eukprot:6020182-Amphidinium_carterae.1
MAMGFSGPPTYLHLPDRYQLELEGLPAYAPLQGIRILRPLRGGGGGGGNIIVREPLLSGWGWAHNL